MHCRQLHPTLLAPPSHSYVRQDDRLWWELHGGVLTTGLVRSALGLYERSAAKRLGISSSRTGHGELLRAYHHLLVGNTSASAARNAAASAAAQATSSDAAEAAAAAEHNAAAVAAFNAAKAEGADAAAAAAAALRPQVPAAGPPAVQPEQPAGAADSAAAGHGRGRGAQRRRAKQRAAAAAAARADAGGMSRAAVGGPSEEEKQRRARALGSQGVMSICCAWGTAQEGAALLQVARAFPTSQLVEASRGQLRLLSCCGVRAVCLEGQACGRAANTLLPPLPSFLLLHRSACVACLRSAFRPSGVSPPARCRPSAPPQTRSYVTRRRLHLWRRRRQGQQQGQQQQLAASLPGT